MGACGNLGGCGACGASQPLPPGGLPPDQTVEGGAQIRVTPQGFNKLTSILPGVINSSLSNGFCVPTGQAGSFGTFGTGVRWCTTTQGTCAPGCKVDVTLNSLTPTVTNQQTMNLRLSTAVHTSVPIDGKVIGIGFSCTLNANSNNLNGDVDIAFGIDPATGELTIHVARINSFQTNLSFSGCSVLSDIANLLSSFVDSFLGQFIIQLLTPTIDDLIQNFLPSPLGIAGMMDVGNLLENVSPGTTASMEARIVPGGYVSLNNGGMSLGVITGLNADEDISTRTPGLASEPALCVPPLTAPNFGAPPASLPITTRSTFALNVANEFNGAPDPGADLAMGISETTLDLAGHHMVTSGAMCLGVGTSFINQLNVGTIGILVPSLSELQSDAGNDPLLLVTRPTRPLDFTIGDNTEASPALTIGVSHLEVDFYAFLYERYVRAFTLDLSLNIGVNLTFEQMPGQPAVIKPSLVGISKDKVQLVALNTQFVRETPQELETKLPAVFDLVTPLLGDLPPINVPTFAGFSLENLSIQHVVTNQDDFLALFASLGTNQALRGLAQHDRFALDAVTKLEAQIPTAQAQSAGTSRFLRVTTPPPDQIRAALDGKGGAMPEVVFDVDRYDAFGRELEWAYNLNGGMFHVYQPGGTLAIRDGAFAWQGKYTIGLKSRVKGDYHTVSQTSYKTVNVDSVGPRVLADKATWDDGIYELQTWDIVSGAYLQYAFSKPGAAGPESPWMDGSTIQLSRVDMDPYLVDNEFALYAKDEAGNVTIALIAPFHGQPGEGGCNCDASGGPTPGGILLVLVVGGILLAPRRRVLVQLARRYNGIATVAVWAGLSITLSLVPGCSCGKNAAKSCDTAADCGEDYCPQGQIPFCIDNTCVCSDDIILGKLGPYSDVAVGADGSTWVSAYHQEYGDLVVAKVDPLAGRVPDEAWEWVDGVPEGPVIVPDSKYRHGIAEKGADVGMYTSIAVAPDGTPVVTYFDRDTASLKFAARVGGVWQSHVIEQGTGDLAETGALIGMYTSLTLRSDDGRPGVAYLAHVADTVNGARAEVRFAAAQTTLPTSAADWMTWTVDTAPLPPDDPNNPNIYPLPEGLGLFVDAARLPTQAPVVVYYDRSAGELKLAKFNTTTGQFAAPVVLAGGGNVDAGWSPSVGVDAQGVVHVAYVDSTNDDLMYVTDAAGATPALVDDGRRIVGTTADGLPKPEYHFVGDDAGMVLANAGTLPMIAYQDATTQELLLATRKTDGTWTHVSIAGATDPWPGAYGFFAADTIAGTDIVMSSWVIDQQASENWVEVFKRPTTIQ
ncbi:MAG TPA: MYXO-CTERM sorting domain-containing protein [Kofleriaceae bacterium]|nr:MYXO-CTERM sorting domain-containing protein [Kofleriaceae bacterium]